MRKRAIDNDIMSLSVDFGKKKNEEGGGGGGGEEAKEDEEKHLPNTKWRRVSVACYFVMLKIENVISRDNGTRKAQRLLDPKAQLIGAQVAEYGQDKSDEIE